MREIYAFLLKAKKSVLDNLVSEPPSIKNFLLRKRSLSLIPIPTHIPNTAIITQNKSQMQTSTSTLSTVKTFNGFNRWMISLVIILSGLFATNANAQVTNYGFSVSSGTYTPLVAPTNVFTGVWDDNTGVSVPIGFTFRFNGVDYTSVFINPNGHLSFGSSNADYGAIVGTVGSAGVIAGYARDLQSQNTAPTGNLDYLSSGGVFTVQWSNVRRYNSTTTNGERIEFQIKLFQGSNNISYVYGTWTDAESATTALVGQVGLRGATNADFKTISVLNTGNWATPTAGATNAETVYYNQATPAVKPASGLTYNFSYPPPCTAPSNQATGLTQGVTTITSIAGSFTAAAPAPSGYLVVRYPNLAVTTNPTDGVSYSVGNSIGLGTVVASGAGTTFTASGLANATAYDFYVYTFNNTGVGCAGNGYNTVSVPNATWSTNAPGAKTSVISGQWGDPNTWSPIGVPTADDNVTIADGNSVTINVAAVANNVTVGQGTGGVLQYDPSVARSLTVSNNVTISANAILRGAVSGNVTTHTLVLPGNITNNGELNFFIDNTGGNLSGVSLTFNGTGNSTLSGTGTTTDLFALTISKGALAQTVEINVPAFSVRDLSASATGALLTSNTGTGTLKFSGSNTFSGTLWSAAAYTIPATLGIWLNNTNFTVQGLAGSTTMSGLLRLTAGTYNVGTAATHVMGGATTSQFVIDGGTLNIAAALTVTNATASFNMSSGTVNVTTVGNSTTSAGFGFTSGTSVFTLTGGTFNLVQASTNATPLDFRVATTAPTITGGLLNIGTAATAINFNFRIQGAIPDVVVDNTTNNKTATVVGTTTFFGSTTINAGATLSSDGFGVTFRGAINNSGTFVPGVTAGSAVTFQGTALQTLGGTVTGNILTATVNNAAGVVITPSKQINTALTLTAGNLSSGGTLTLGNGAATSFTFISSGGTLSGTVATNYGTGTNNFTYNSTTAAQTTGGELPATAIATGTLTINNTGGGVTLNSPLTIQKLTLTAGKLTATANLLKITGTATGDVSGGSATSYVVGALERSLPTAASGNYNFPIGKSVYNAISLNSPVTTAAIAIRAQSFDAAPAGSSPTLSPTNNRYWEISPVPAGLTSVSTVTLTDVGITASTRVGEGVAATEAAATYANKGGTVVIGTPGNVTSTGNINPFGTAAGGNSTFFITATPTALAGGIYAVGPTATAATLQPDGVTPYGPDRFFSSLNAAIDATNNASPSITGNVILELQDDHAGAVTVLNTTYQGTAGNGLIIRPRADAAIIHNITISNTGGLFNFVGAKYVTIDGRLGGAGSTKAISLNNTFVGAGTTVSFSNDAQNNTVKYCLIKGQTTTGGTVSFGLAAAGGTGNDNNTIDHNNIGDGAVTPLNAVFSSGTTSTVATNNSGNIITDNNIFNYFSATAASNGVNISGGSTDWTIGGNRFYQTTARIQTTSSLHAALTVASGGNNFTIQGNTVGYADSIPSGTYTLSGVGNTFRGINLSSLGTTTASTIQGNMVTAISQNTNTTTGNACVGIYVTGLSTNLTGNTVGSMSATGAISYTNSSSSATDVSAIYNNGSSAWVGVDNNNIGGITATNNNITPAAANIYGIRVNTGATAAFTAQGNTIGGTIANSILSTSPATGTTVAGIYSVLPTSTITLNTIQNLAAAGGTGTGVVGIWVAGSGTGANHTVSQNTISSLSNSNASGPVVVSGINFTGSTGLNTVSRNFIHSLSTVSTSSSATLNGIIIVGGTGKYENNRIALGTGLTNGLAINGINETGGTDSIRFNTVYIGGAPTTGAGNTAAFRSTVVTNVRAYQDNIFFNARSNSGSTGKHYAIAVGGTGVNPAGLTSNFNLLRAPGTNAFTGLYNGSDALTLANWQAATGQDGNSISEDPCLADPTNALPDLHLTFCGGIGSPADGTGTPLSLVPNDFEAQVRAGLTPTDIGADAGDYGPFGPDAAFVALTNPTALSCHSAAENVIVTVKNNGTTTLNPGDLTVGVIVSGQVAATFNVSNLTTLLPQATEAITVGQISTTANGTYTFATTVGTTGDVNPANNTNTTNVTINYTALSVVGTAGTPTMCNSGNSTLTAVAAGGTLPYTYLWSGGLNNGGTNNTSPTLNTTGTITATATYTITVTDFCNVTANNPVLVTVNSPTVSVPPATRCGAGTVTLTATPTPNVGNTVNWYAANTGGSPIATGTTFSPSVTGNVTYYVTNSIGGGSEFGGKLSSTGADGDFITTAWGVVFNSVSGFTLNSTMIYPVGTGTVTIALYNSSGTELASTAAVSVTGTGVTTPVTVPLGFSVPTGTGYRLLLKAFTGLTGIVRDFTNTFPYNSPSGNLSVTGGWSGSASTAYYWMYNMNISSGCETTPRVPVNVTVTTAPTITAPTATPPVICAGQSSILATSSSNPDYTYTWTPGPQTGASVTVSPTVTTTYTVNAVDNTAGPFAGCAVSATVPVTVNPVPTGVTATASTYTVCSGATIDLFGSAAQSATVLSQDFTAAAGWTTLNGGSSPAVSNWYIQPSPYTDAAGSATFSGFTTVNGGNFAYSNSDAGGNGSQSDSKLISPVFSLAGYTGASLTFEHSYQLWSGDVTVQLEISTDGGTNWGLLVDYKGTNVGTVTNNAQTTAPATINLNAYAGMSNLRLRYNYVSAWGFWWIVDNVQVTGSVPPVTYSWTSTPNLNSFSSNLQNPVGITPFSSPITYTVTATTAASCSTSATTASITASTLSLPTPTTTPVSCFGGSNGTVTAAATGGTAIAGPNPYTYTINATPSNTTGATSGVFTGLPAGNYIVTATDGLPCSVQSVEVTVSQPATAVSVTAVGDDPTCYNLNDGIVTATPSGGTPGSPDPYTYTIDAVPSNVTGATSGIFTGLAAGTYIVTVTDGNGCQDQSDAVILTSPAQPVFTASAADPICAGQNVVLTATSGFTNYLWTGGTFDDATTNPTTGQTPTNGTVYSVSAQTITDGCVVNASTAPVVVNPILPVSVTIAVSPSTDVCELTEVTFTATPTNGGGSPTYKWFKDAVEIPGETSSTYVTTDLVGAEVITAELTSSEACTSGNPDLSNAITMNVTGSVEVSVTLASSANPSCSGEPVTFTATPTGGGGAPEYEFFVNGISVQGGDPVSFLNTYTYTPEPGDLVFVKLKSSFACALGDGTANSTTITQDVNPTPVAPVITPSGPTTFCAGGSVTLTSDYEGGNTWSTTETTDAIIVTTSGTYTVTQTQLGCTSDPSVAVVVTVNPNPVVNITGNANLCTGGSTLLTANVTAGGPIVTYAWSLNAGPTIGSGSTFSATAPGSYTVTVTNAGPCSTTSAAFVVVENTPPTVDATTTCPVLFPGQAATITTTTVPPTGLSYAWTQSPNPAVIAITPSYLTGVNAAGTYIVTVTDANGCTGTDQQIITNLSGALAAGTYPIPSTCGFTTIQGAAAYINANGVTGGAVIFDVAAGHTEIAPAGGIVIGSATLNATTSNTNTVTFQKAGAGTNPTVTAFTPQATGSLVDAVIKLVGANNISFNEINVTENGSNGNATAATNNKTEFGYALLYLSATDGAQNNTIQNSSITLTRTYTNSIGVYSNTRHTATNGTVLADITDPTTGPNKGNKIYGNTISNVNVGVIFIGSATAANQDDLNDIGGTSLATGNNISNYGGAATATAYVGLPAAVFGVYLLNQKNYNLSFNSIVSAALSTTTALRGILTDYSSAPTGTITNNINNNTVSFSQAGTGTLQCITTASTIGALANVTHNSNSNNIINNTITANITLFGVANLGAFGTLNMNNNIVRSNTSTATTTGLVGVTNQGAVVTAVNMNNNQIGNASGNAITFSAATSGQVNAITNTAAASGSSLSINGNDVRGIVQTVAGTNAHNYIVNSSTAPTTYNFNNNTFTNLTANTSGSVTFIANAVTMPATAVSNMNGNSIVTAFSKPVAGGTIAIHTTNSGTPLGAVVNFQNNNFSNMSFTGATTFTGYNNTDGGSPTKVVTGNTIGNITGGSSAITAITVNFNGTGTSVSSNIIGPITGTGAITAIALGTSATSATNSTVSNNTISGLVSSGTGGAVIGITNGTPSTASTISLNSVSTSSSTTGNVTGITVAATAPTVSGNTVSGLSSAGASTTVLGIGVTGGTTVTVTGNNVNTLSGSGATTPVTTGISVSSGTTVNVSKNKIYNLAETGAITTATTSSVNGILLSGGTTVNTFNNIIGDLRAPASSNVDAIRGINITSTTTGNQNVSYNTINLSAIIGGANFGSTGLFATGSGTATAASLSLRNNIIVNTSFRNGTGSTVAYRRSNASGANFNAASNNNLLYAGTPGTNNLIYTDGVGGNDQTLAEYKGRFSPIDNEAVTENPTWVSTTGSDPTFLHINTTVQTQIESGASNVAGITDDYDGDIRFGNPGYIGTSTTRPDIGADEFDGVSPACTSSAPAGTVTNNAPFTCTSNTAVVLQSSGSANGAGIVYQWMTSTTLNGTYVPVTGGTGANTTTYTTAANLTAGVYYYLLDVKCSALPSAQTNKVTLTVTQTPTATTPATQAVCLNQPLTITSNVTGVDGTTVYSWTGPNSFTASTPNANIASVTAAAAGNYTLIVTNGTTPNTCASTPAVTTVTVNTLPGAIASASPTTLCAGSQLNLTSTGSQPSGYSVAPITYAPTTDPGGAGILTGDDVVSTTQAIPFNFNYYGTNFNNVFVYTNGFIQLGSSSSSTTVYAQTLPSTTAPNNVIAGMWSDLNANVAATPLPAIRVYTTGTTPNRIYTVHYNNVPFYNGNNTPTVSGNNDFYIQLFETSNIIEVHIGEVTGATSTTNNNKTVGIKNSDGTQFTSPVGRNAGTWNILTTAKEGYRFTPVQPAFSYLWSGPNSFSSTDKDPVIPSTVVGNSGTYSVVITNTGTGCSSASASTAAVTVNPRPLGVLSGDVAYCTGLSTTSNLTVTVTNTGVAPGPYSGTITDGVNPPIAFSGATSPITVTVPAAATTTTYTIATLASTAPNGCTSIPADLSGSATITINPLPAAPTVSVVHPTCAVATGTINVTAPLGAGFTYNIDNGAFQASPSFPGLAAGSSHDIRVKNSNGCISLPTNATLNAQPFLPGTPAPIEGIHNVCPYINNGSQLTYSVPVVPGATAYVWTIPPTATLVSQTQNSIIITLGAGFIAHPNKRITVRAQSVCGTSSARELNLLAQFPNTPGPIVGTTNVCGVIGTANSITYTIPSVLSATTYIWTAQAGTTSISHPNGPGVNDTTVTVTFTNGFTNSSITVQAQNDCGLSGVRSLPLTRNAPGQPGLISGPSNACPHVLPGGTPATYSIVPVLNATSYTWTTPAGSVVTHPNGLGPNDNTITVQYPVGFTSGAITVTVTTLCGTSPVRSMTITKLVPGTPSIIDVIQLQPCPDRVYSYTLAAMPANATLVLWTAPVGGTIESGQGTTSITVSYLGTAINGNVTAQGINNCGASSVRQSLVKLPACPPVEPPPPPFSGGGNDDGIQIKGNVQPVVAESMEVKVFPNPTVHDFKLQVITSAKEAINVRVLDIAGRLYKEFKTTPYQVTALGSELKAGAYFIEVRQGKTLKTTKVVKF